MKWILDKCTIRLTLALVTAGLLLGCWGTPKLRVVGVVTKAYVERDFWQRIHAGVSAGAEDFDVEILLDGPKSDTDFGEQIRIVDTMVDLGVDALAIAPVNSQALVAAVRRATEQGVAVAIYDSALSPGASDAYFTFVATDNKAAGRLAARELARLMERKGSVIEVKNMLGSASTDDREDAFNDEMSRTSEIKIVNDALGRADSVITAEVVRVLLEENSEIDGLFASAEPIAVGAANALKSTGLNGQVRFVAFDSGADMVADLRQGTIDALVVQDAFCIGYSTIRAIVEKLEGGQPKREILLPASIVHANDLNGGDVLPYPVTGVAGQNRMEGTPGNPCPLPDSEGAPAVVPE